MQRSRSIDAKPGLRRCAAGLSHGFQMDLKQAVQLEKQELQKMGLLPPPIDVDAPLPKAVAQDDDEEDDDAQPGGSYWLYRQQRLVRRAASFTSGQCPAPMPCSPPVPIPQHHEAQRRYSAAGGLGDHMTHGVDAEQLQHLSKSQCEARLWDEFWNYKLSFESRESFEANNCQLKECGTRARASSDHSVDERRLLKYRSESSMTSTADTVLEDEEDLDGSVGPEEDEHVHRYGSVFEMDDL
ncbi:Gamma-aminobutyric acid receptor subunit beta-3 [Phytophthora cinnamomi]|uniref:Gamma-aminobutyric acid receptor subunit beta-3 n=1 Tax=Phytophthora cinnamomi TaxID=4785 RepID=UPI0035596DA9|nr:Gamma-aminobutyric acid receptor subunit beta-3 [Phytophthora cinnamomi]